MSDNILLTEANYKDKYPPLGLMKISTFHKIKGDNVIYSRDLKKMDRRYFKKIYIATRFSFHWKKTKELINFYLENYDAEILIGGIHASINPDLYENEFGIKPHVGSLKGEINMILEMVKKDNVLSLFFDDINRYGIDVLPPDYSIFDNQNLPFNNTLRDNYLLRATKGCERNCSFCDVKKICEGYIEKLPIKPIIEYIDTHFGKKLNVLFFDDNTLMSNKFEDIVSELIDSGFSKGTKLNRKLRSCDFNQGLDLRRLNQDKLELLNSICVSPIRFAFDDISMKKLFQQRIQEVILKGIKNVAIYVLYNYDDTPQDFYERLQISVNLNKIHNCRIFSFPMKYVPNDITDRKYIGKHWTKRMIRGIQCILNCSHGIVPVNTDYFENAFGKDYNEFYKIINLPEKYIIYRSDNESNINRWKNDLELLSDNERIEAFEAISEGKGKVKWNNNSSIKINNFLSYYLNEV